MKLNNYKIYVVATTEFGSAIRTKSFIIGLLLLPVIMGASILIQLFVAERVDTKSRKFVVIDKSGALYPAIEQAAQAHNAKLPDARGKNARPRMEPEQLSLPRRAGTAIRRWNLSSPTAFTGASSTPTLRSPPASSNRRREICRANSLEYHSNNPNDDTIRNWLTEVVNKAVRARRFRSAGLDQALAERLSQPVLVDNLGLVERSSDRWCRPRASRRPKRSICYGPRACPAGLHVHHVFRHHDQCPAVAQQCDRREDEPDQRGIARIGHSVRVDDGKAAGQCRHRDAAGRALRGRRFPGRWPTTATPMSFRPGLIAALVLFLFLAILLYGSLYMAVGSACSELKDAQSLMMPVMLISMLPIFVWTAVLKNPASPLSVGMSLFPPASPFLMLMRLALRPAPPAWQVVLSVVLTTLTAMAIVWAAGKIFRTGLLMQGKPPSFIELARWVMAK